MRMQKLVALMFLSMAFTGCFGSGGNDTVEDDGMPDGPMVPVENVSLPPAHVLGLVVGPDFVPIGGATVYAESVDITDAVNNIADYVDLKQNTTITTNANGEFNLTWDDSYQRIAVRAPGLTPWASQILSVPANESVELAVELQALPDTTVTAHRGGALYAPDNTLSALHKSGLLGIPRAEIDIQWTSDQVFVLWHDGVVEDQTGDRVWQTSSEDMMARDVGRDYHESFAGETVPTFAEALDVMAQYGTVPVVELKITDDPRHVEMVNAAMQQLIDAGLQDTAVVISFDPSIDTQCGALDMLCGYIEAQPEGQRTDPAGVGKDVLGPFIIEHHMPKEIATADYVAESQESGMLVTVWTVNDVQEALDLDVVGVDAITTDMPWDVMQALATS